MLCEFHFNILKCQKKERLKKETREKKKGGKGKKKLLIDAKERNTPKHIKVMRKQISNSVQLRDQLEISPKVPASFSSVTQ